MMYNNQPFNPFIRHRLCLKKILSVLFLSALLAGCGPVRQIINPYQTVDWDKYGQYRAHLHTHTMVSDGWMNPQTVVDKYREAGYQILAISDHNSVTWPWENFSGFAAGSSIGNRLARQELKPQEEDWISPEELVFRGVDPSGLGMIAVQANELSSHHHVNSFFNDHNGTTTEVESLKATAAKNGLTVLNHPGRYHDPNPGVYSLEWYTGLFRRFPHLLGMEVYNCGKRFPHDDLLWDSLLTVLVSERPVWGFSNDDMHSLRDFGRNWNVFPLPELRVEEVRRAMEKGSFYFAYAPDGQNGPPPPVIKSIHVNRRKGKIRINASGSDSIAWITEGKKIVLGEQFRLKRPFEHIRYIRAELYGADETIVCTQPFIFENRNSPEQKLTR